MDLYEVATRLIGPVRPVGETNSDDERYDNLMEMARLTGMLVSELLYIADRYEDRQEFSMKRAGRYARGYLGEIGLKK